MKQGEASPGAGHRLLALLPGRLGRRITAPDEDTEDAVFSTTSRQALGASHRSPADTPPAEKRNFRFDTGRDGGVDDDDDDGGSGSGGVSGGGVRGGDFRT